MIGKQLKKFCDNIQDIENYDKAVADKENMWCIHHRREIEIDADGNEIQVSMKQLMENGLYYKRPASELIFMLQSDHIHIHNKIQKRNNKYWVGKHHTEKTKKTISAKNIGKPSPFKGRHHSEETKQKISEAKLGSIPWTKGIHLPEDMKKKISDTRKHNGCSAGEKNPMYGHSVKEFMTEENYIQWKKNCGNSNRGSKWWNNGKVSKRSKECPGSEWTLGRLLKSI